jgi:hypothetical protein
MDVLWYRILVVGHLENKLRILSEKIPEIQVNEGDWLSKS